MASKQALILVNRKARSGGANLQPAVDIIEAGGIRPILVRTVDAEDIDAAIRAHADRIDRIVIGGGDGTVNAALESVLNSKRPLGILPLGTGNDLARTLNIPLSLEAAADVIVNGRVRRIDLGMVNREYFINAASIGLAVNVTHSLTREMKKKWGPVAYLIALVDAFRSNRAFRAQVRCDGRSHRLKSIQITIGNGQHYGGGMTIREDARIDDHILRCYSLEPQGIWELINAAPSIMKGSFEHRERVWLMDGRSFQVVTHKPMPVDADGELLTHTPAHFSVEKNILPVIIPPDSPTASRAQPAG